MKALAVSIMKHSAIICGVAASMMGVAGSESAMAATFVDTTTREALEGIAVVLEANVVEIEQGTMAADGEELPVSYLHLAVERVLVGHVDGDRVRLVLPGGDIDGLLVHFSGTPTVQVGDKMLAVVHSNGDDVVRIDRWQTGWFLQATATDRSIATTAWRDPVVSLPCDGRPQVARSWTEAPSASGDGPAASPADVASDADGNPLFVEDPESVALSWDALGVELAACILEAGTTGTTITGTLATDGGVE